MPHSFDRVSSDDGLPARADVAVVGAGVIGVTAALELARAGLSVALVDKGFVAANDGNISFRLGNGRYLCTPTGVSKGNMKPADLGIVDDTGKQISGPKPRTSEIKLHLEIYHELPHINAVVHAHPPHATAFAVAGMEIPVGILPEVEIFIGQVPIARYDTPAARTSPRRSCRTCATSATPSCWPTTARSPATPRWSRRTFTWKRSTSTA